VLTFGGLMGVALQTPAGAIIDATHRKRALIAAALGALVCGAALLASRASAFHVYASQLLIGGAGPFIGPGRLRSALWAPVSLTCNSGAIRRLIPPVTL
jgi:hypothetical protein